MQAWLKCPSNFYDCDASLHQTGVTHIVFLKRPQANHWMQEMEKVGPQRQYIMVYFNADAELSTIPDTVFFQQLHAALHPSHKRRLKVWVLLRIQTCTGLALYPLMVLPS